VIGRGDWVPNRIMPNAMHALAKEEAIAVRNSPVTGPWQHLLEAMSGYLLLAGRLTVHYWKPLDSSFN
jgi:CDP-glucose 4,6-dehydratase